MHPCILKIFPTMYFNNYFIMYLTKQSYNKTSNLITITVSFADPKKTLLILFHPFFFCSLMRFTSLENSKRDR